MFFRVNAAFRLQVAGCRWQVAGVRIRHVLVSSKAAGVRIRHVLVSSKAAGRESMRHRRFCRRDVCYPSSQCQTTNPQNLKTLKPKNIEHHTDQFPSKIREIRAIRVLNKRSAFICAFYPRQSAVTPQTYCIFTILLVKVLPFVCRRAKYSPEAMLLPALS